MDDLMNKMDELNKEIKANTEKLIAYIDQLNAEIRELIEMLEG